MTKNKNRYFKLLHANGVPGLLIVMAGANVEPFLAAWREIGQAVEEIDYQEARRVRAMQRQQRQQGV